MVRVAVPPESDLQPGDTLNVSGVGDHDYRTADVQVDGETARRLRVREDEEGRYVGPPEHYAAEVAEALGVGDGPEPEEPDDGLAAAVEAGECPWCDDYAGDHVGQHASSAHPEEWDAYTEGGE